MDFFIELNKKYFLQNIKNITHTTKKTIAPVIKSNAYGHGMKEIISLLKEAPTIDRICVAYTSEATEAAKLGWRKKIVIMSSSTDIILNNSFEYFVYSFEFFDELLKQAKKKKTIVNLHIKIDVGMNSLGFQENQIDKLIQYLHEHKEKINAVGICTHFPRINYALTTEIQEQMTIFKKIVNKIKNIYPYILVHPFSSKGIPLVNEFEEYCDFIRLGGSIYGLLNTEQRKKINFELKQIMTLKTKILSIKSVKKDDYIGYGVKTKTQDNTLVAIASLGYGYGLNNNCCDSFGSFNDQLCPIVGLICMNNIFFNISNLKEKPTIGDYLILTTEQIPEITAANISSRLLAEREYYLTSFLHSKIKRVII